MAGPMMTSSSGPATAPQNAPIPVVGIQVFPGDGFIRPADLGRAVEDRGFEALFFPEHLHMPVERTIDFPIPIPLPEIYKRNFDPFLAFAAISSVTSRLTFGTGISLVAQRDPILLAKTIATLDHLCLRGQFVSCPRHADHLDGRHSDIPWPLRGFRQDLVLAEAVRQPARTRTHRRFGEEFRADPALGRRMDPGA